MRIAFGIGAVLLLAATPLRADVKVALKDGRMGIEAHKASVKEILDRVAGLTGMKVIYDGPLPTRSITKSVPDRTPADAVLGILEGEGINFAVILNPAGTQIETLLVTGPSKARPAPAGPPGIPAPGDAGEWAVEGEQPPPPPPPPDQGLPPAPPGEEQKAAATPLPPTLPTPPPDLAVRPIFGPQGPGPVLLPLPGVTPSPPQQTPPPPQ